LHPGLTYCICFHIIRRKTALRNLLFPLACLLVKIYLLFCNTLVYKSYDRRRIYSELDITRPQMICVKPIAQGIRVKTALVAVWPWSHHLAI
jgi:hypothetical protein